jgi:thiazole/oxazole-forming peptide maturase SagD family component
MPEWLIFAGPSLANCVQPLAGPWRFAPPIRRQDLGRHFAQGHRHFVILDGEFSQSWSVSVSEIRRVIEQGAVVCGASSMGALRAAEAHPVGMLGHGWIFERYVSGEISADDEVALTFDVQTQRALTEPLVNIRWCLQRALVSGVIDAKEHGELLELARSLPFERRSWRALRAADRALVSAVERLERFAAASFAHIDRKRLDALELLALLAAGRLPAPVESRARPPRSPLEQPSVLPRSAFLGLPSETRKLPGTHRQRALSDVLPLVEVDASAAGMSRLAEVGTLEDCGVWVFNSVRPHADARDNTVNGGVGWTREAASVAALAESIERSAMDPRARQVLLGTVSELGERTLLHPNDLVLNADCQWKPETELSWWPMTSLSMTEPSADVAVWVPATAVFFPEDRGAVLHEQSSTGLASGSSLPEATLYGLLECVEREANTLWRWTRRGRVVRLDALRPQAECLLRQLSSAGVEVHAWCVESLVPIPTFQVLLDDQARDDPRFLTGGSACHLDPNAAFEKALLEALYARFAVIAGAREDLERQASSHAGRSYREVRRQVMTVFPSGGELRLSELPDQSAPSISEDIARVLAAIEQTGLSRALACRLSPAGSKIETVRVVVPGLECCLREKRIGQRLVDWVNAWGFAQGAAA